MKNALKLKSEDEDEEAGSDNIILKILSVTELNSQPSQVSLHFSCFFLQGFRYFLPDRELANMSYLH